MHILEKQTRNSQFCTLFRDTLGKLFYESMSVVKMHWLVKLKVEPNGKRSPLRLHRESDIMLMRK
jgi:hypothetical protein